MEIKIDEETLRELILTNKEPTRYTRFQDIFPPYLLVFRVYGVCTQYDYITIGYPTSLDDGLAIRKDLMEHPDKIPENLRNNAAGTSKLPYKMIVEKFDNVRMVYHPLNY